MQNVFIVNAGHQYKPVGQFLLSGLGPFGFVTVNIALLDLQVVNTIYDF